MNDKRVIIIRGLPGSGKSTMALKHFVDKKGYKICEADHFFYDNGVYNFDYSKLADAHEYCHNKAISELERGGKVVISNTFSRLWEIKELLGKLPVGRNEVSVLHCHGGTGTVHNVPEFVVERMKQRWQTWKGEKHVKLDFTNKKPRVVRFFEPVSA